MLNLIFVALQTITVNVTQPCFMNFTRGANIFHDCGASADYIKFALLPWEWITGGYFSLAFATILILFTYIKYHKAIYPIMIGIIMIPISFWLYPDTFISTGIILGVGLGGASYVIYLLTKQTKEF
jgi:hypothetical protein